MEGGHRGVYAEGGNQIDRAIEETKIKNRKSQNQTKGAVVVAPFFVAVGTKLAGAESIE